MRYRPVLMNLLVVSFFLPFGLLCVTLVAHPDPVVKVGAAICAVPSLWLAGRGWRIGAYAFDDHLVVRSAYRTRRFSWSKIMKFETGLDASSGLPFNVLIIQTTDKRVAVNDLREHALWERRTSPLEAAVVALNVTLAAWQEAHDTER